MPGTAWRYSGGGITVMQQAMTDVTGKAFPQLMEETVLGPLGMTHSNYEQPLPAAWAAQPETPYEDDGTANKGDGIAVMTNGFGGGQLAEEIQRTIARDYHWPDFAPKQQAAMTLDPKLLDNYAGYYRQGRFVVM